MKNTSYYSFQWITNNMSEYNSLYTKLFSHESKFDYIKTEFAQPYKLQNQFYNTFYLACNNSMPYGQVYQIVNGIKKTDIVKLPNDPVH